jgi:hypothetical protein
VPEPTDVFSANMSAIPGTGSWGDIFTWTVSADVPKTVRFGVMVDNLDSVGYSPTAIKATSSLGGSVGIQLDAAKGFNKIPDWCFFDITDAVPGEAFTLSGQADCYTQVVMRALRSCPVGAFDNSPAIYRWVGTKEKHLPSRRDDRK